MSKQIAVICESKDKYENWLKDNVWYEDQNKFVFVNNPVSLYGREFCEVIRVGSWYKNNAAVQYYELTLTRIR